MSVEEYVGSKIDMTRRESGTEIKITQPVLVQSLEDEFNLPEGKPPRVPATAGQILITEPGGVNLDKKGSKTYRSGTAKLMVHDAMEQARYLQLSARTSETYGQSARETSQSHARLYEIRVSNKKQRIID